MTRRSLEDLPRSTVLEVIWKLDLVPFAALDGFVESDRDALITQSCQKPPIRPTESDQALNSPISIAQPLMPETVLELPLKRPREEVSGPVAVQGTHGVGRIAVGQV